MKELSKSGLPFERVMATAIDRVPPAMPEMRNETITGERATLDVRKHETARWETFACVHQRGAWKLALHDTKVTSGHQVHRIMGASVQPGWRRSVDPVDDQDVRRFRTALA